MWHEELLHVCSGTDSCPSESRRVLSYDHQLLSPYNMTASSADLTSPVHYLVSRSNSPVRVWCTAPDTGTSHHIYLNFTYPVVVEHVISAGFSNGYVTNFSIEYSSNWSNGFTTYHNSHIQQVHIIEGHNLTLFHLHHLCSFAVFLSSPHWFCVYSGPTTGSKLSTALDPWWSVVP